MAHLATAKINVDPDLTRLTLVMRVLAKHLDACADELAGIATGTPKPSMPIRAWRDDKLVEKGGE